MVDNRVENGATGSVQIRNPFQMNILSCFIRCILRKVAVHKYDVKVVWSCVVDRLCTAQAVSVY